MKNRIWIVVTMIVVSLSACALPSTPVPTPTPAIVVRVEHLDGPIKACKVKAGSIVAGTFAVSGESQTACQLVEFTVDGQITIQAQHGVTIHYEKNRNNVRLELEDLGWKTFRIGILQEDGFSIIETIGD